MSASWELVLRGVRTVRRSGMWWAFGVATFVIINLAFWPSLEDSGALDAYEGMEDLMEAFGVQSISTPDGYVDGQVYALLLPLLFSAMAITMVSALTAGDENAGRLELLHALPLSRRKVWLGRWTAGMAVLAAVALVGGGSTLVSLPLFSLTDVSVGRVVMATVGCALLAAFHGAVAYLAAGFGASRGLSAGAGIAVLVVGYLMSYVLPISDALAGARDWSPWYWSIGEQPVTNGIEVWRLLLTAALTAVLVAIGTWAVDRRDIHTA